MKSRKKIKNGTVKCPFCGKGAKLLIRYKCLGDFIKNIWQCSDCRAGFVVPLPSRESLKNFYNHSSYFVDYQENETIRFRSSFPSGLTSKIFRDIAFYDTQRFFRLLDIGSGIGNFITEVMNLFPNSHVLGIEPSKWAVQHSRKNSLNVLEGFFEDIESAIQKESFDIVTAFEVIEHVCDPVTFVLKIKRILGPEGYFIFSTPDFDCPAYKLRRNRTLHFNEEHLFYFTEQSLRKLLKTDFTILKIFRLPGSLMTGVLIEEGTASKHALRGMKRVIKRILKIQPFQGLYKKLSSLLGISSFIVIAKKRS